MHYDLHKNDWEDQECSEQNGTPATKIAQSRKDVRCFQRTRDAQIAGRNGACQKLDVVCIHGLLSVRCVSALSVCASLMFSRSCNNGEASARMAMTHAQNALMATHEKYLQHLDNAIQSGHATILSRIDSLNTSSTGLSQPASSALAHDRMQGRRKYLNRRSTLKFRLALPRWFTDTVWELAAYKCEGCCILQLRPANIREEGAFVFEVVRSGNIEAVRALLASGELSSSDYEHDPYRRRNNSLTMVCTSCSC